MASGKRSQTVKLSMPPVEPNVSFFCLNFPETFKPGTLKLPTYFLEKYGKKIPSRVYIHLPNGTVWIATFEHTTERIEGLDNQLMYYGVKPYHFVLFRYNGGPDFSIEIFTPYALEMNYPVDLKPYKKGRPTRHNGGLHTDTYLQPKVYTMDRLFSTFRYNAFSSGIRQFELKITNNHLQQQLYTEILTKEACSDLGVNRSMRWIQLGFRKHMWHIQLKWQNEGLLLDSGWNYFAKASGLSVGDTCVLQSTSHPQIFEIAVLENDMKDKINRDGLQQGKGLAKWFKVLDRHTLLTGEMELPRLFVKDFGGKIGEKVKFLLPDGFEYDGYFCNAQKSFSCFKKLFSKYSVTEYYVFFFEYLGASTFFVSIYNVHGMHIFNDLKDKLMLKDVLRQPQFEVVTLSNQPMEKEKVSGGTVEPNTPIHLDATWQLNSCTVLVRISHVDQNGHGVFLARHLLPIYRSWKNGTIVTLLCASKEWKVAVHRKKKTCRFGRGWNKFTLENEVASGQKLIFVYVSEYTFEVTIS